MAEIFISYTEADQAWAFWIGQELEKLGHAPHIHDWEVASGANILEWMEDRLQKSNNALLVISTIYLTKGYSSRERRAAEWAAVGARPNFALPVFVENCEPPLMLANIKRCNLFGVSEDEARLRLTEYLTPAGRPRAPVVFPVSNTRISLSQNSPIKFPGGDDAVASAGETDLSTVSDSRNESGERIGAVRTPERVAAPEQDRKGVESANTLNLNNAKESGSLPVEGMLIPQRQPSHYRLRLLVFGLPLVAITSFVGFEWRGLFRNFFGTPISSTPPVTVEPQWKLEVQGGNIVNLCTEPAKIFEDHDFRSKPSSSLQPCEPLKNVADDADSIASATLNGEMWLSFKLLHRPAFIARKSLCEGGLQGKC